MWLTVCQPRARRASTHQLPSYLEFINLIHGSRFARSVTG